MGQESRPNEKLPEMIGRIYRDMKRNIWKIIVVSVVIVIYIALLGYISSHQSNYDVNIMTEQEVYEFSTEMSEYAIPVKIENNSNRMLSSAAGQDVFLSYHLYDLNGNILVYDNARSPFSESIFANSKGKSELHIVPVESGEYIIGIDIVQENVAWFSDNGNEEKRVRIIVK